jgi:hypothetical protein
MFVNLLQNQIQSLLDPEVELHFQTHGTFFSMIANISLLKNISLDDDIALMLQKIYKN